MQFVFDGLDLSGKTTCIENIIINHNDYLVQHNIELISRGIMTKNTDLPRQKFIVPKDEKNIIFTCDPVVAFLRDKTIIDRDQYHSIKNLIKYYDIYYSLAFEFELPVINTTRLSANQVCEAIFTYIKNIVETGNEIFIVPDFVKFNHPDKYIVPDIPPIGMINYEIKKVYHQVIKSGESRTIIKLEFDENSIFNNMFHIISLKESVYSHTSNRADIVNGTMNPRLECTRIIMDLMHKYKPGIYTYLCVGHKNIVAYATDYDMCMNEESIVKFNMIGTDKHRYLTQQNTNNQNFKCFDEQSRKIIGEPMFRHDKREPNYKEINIVPNEEIIANHKLLEKFGIKIQENKIFTRHGDQCMYDDFRKKYYPRNNKHIGISIAKFLKEVARSVDLDLQDICFMINNYGKIYGEISSDCMRIKHTNEDLDKDIWRKMESPEKLIEKWQKLTSFFMKTYDIDYYNYPTAKRRIIPCVDLLFASKHTDIYISKFKQFYDVIIDSNLIDDNLIDAYVIFDVKSDRYIKFSRSDDYEYFLNGKYILHVTDISNVVYSHDSVNREIHVITEDELFKDCDYYENIIDDNPSVEIFISLDKKKLDDINTKFGYNFIELK